MTKVSFEFEAAYKTGPGVPYKVCDVADIAVIDNETIQLNLPVGLNGYFNFIIKKEGDTKPSKCCKCLEQELVAVKDAVHACKDRSNCGLKKIKKGAEV